MLPIWSCQIKVSTLTIYILLYLFPFLFGDGDFLLDLLGLADWILFLLLPSLPDLWPFGDVNLFYLFPVEAYVSVD